MGSPAAPALRSDCDALVAAGLSACDHMLAAHIGRVTSAFGEDGLGVVDLPALGPEPLVDAQIKVAAVVYWCREVERAGVLPLVEALAEAVARGSALLVTGASIHKLVEFWRSREDRFTAPERAAIYQRVLAKSGTFVAQGFDVWFGLLVDALVELGRTPRNDGIGHLRARVARLALDVGRELSERSVGVTGFAARDIVGQVKQALAVLQDPQLQRALGGGPPWTIVVRHAPQLLGRTPDVSRDITRAESGAQILRWIAEHASALEGAAQALDRDHPIVHAAEAWRAATRGG